MKKIKFYSLILFFSISSCSMVNQQDTQQDTQQSAQQVRLAQSAYNALKNQGVVRFNYVIHDGTEYWMWMDLRNDSQNKQTMMAQIVNHEGSIMKFYRPTVNLIFHKNPAYNNFFIIDFGKPYETGSTTYLKRYMLVEKTGLYTFRGRMLDYISWTSPRTFEILDDSKFPSHDVVPNATYDDAKTSGKILSPPLPYGISKTFDRFRDRDHLWAFNYKISNGVAYWMWLDFRLGMDSEMIMVYHKPGVHGTRFLSKRKIVDILLNKENPNEFIIDLGKPNGGIGRFIYVAPDGRWAFRGTVTDNPAWGMGTHFSFIGSSGYGSTTLFNEYDNVGTQGDIDNFELQHIGGNPNSAQEALDEAIQKVHGVDSFNRASVSYDTPGAGTVIKTHRKEFYTQKEGSRITKVKFIHTIEYNGRDDSTLFGKYFGERFTINTSVDVETDNFHYVVIHKGQRYSVSELMKKGYTWYSILVPGKSIILGVTNTSVLQGSNIWKTTRHRIGHSAAYRAAFVVKKINDRQFAIVDPFQSVLWDGQPMGLHIPNDFDFDNPPAKYIYTKKR